MSICTRCGAIFNKNDLHTCKSENVPAQGKEIIKGVEVTNEASK